MSFTGGGCSYSYEDLCCLTCLLLEAYLVMRFHLPVFYVLSPNHSCHVIKGKRHVLYPDLSADSYRK